MIQILLLFLAAILNGDSETEGAILIRSPRFDGINAIAVFKAFCSRDTASVMKVRDKLLESLGDASLGLSDLCRELRELKVPCKLSRLKYSALESQDGPVLVLVGDDPKSLAFCLVLRASEHSLEVLECGQLLVREVKKDIFCRHWDGIAVHLIHENSFALSRLYLLPWIVIMGIMFFVVPLRKRLFFKCIMVFLALSIVVAAKASGAEDIPKKIIEDIGAFESKLRSGAELRGYYQCRPIGDIQTCLKQIHALFDAEEFQSKLSFECRLFEHRFLERLSYSETKFFKPGNRIDNSFDGDKVYRGFYTPSDQAWPGSLEVKSMKTEDPFENGNGPTFKLDYLNWLGFRVSCFGDDMKDGIRHRMILEDKRNRVVAARESSELGTPLLEVSIEYSEPWASYSEEGFDKYKFKPMRDLMRINRSLRLSNRTSKFYFSPSEGYQLMRRRDFDAKGRLMFDVTYGPGSGSREFGVSVPGSIEVLAYTSHWVPNEVFSEPVFSIHLHLDKIEAKSLSNRDFQLQPYGKDSSVVDFTSNRAKPGEPHEYTIKATIDEVDRLTPSPWYPKIVLTVVVGILMFSGWRYLRKLRT